MRKIILTTSNRNAFQILPAPTTKALYLFLNGMIIGYTTFAFFAARSTSPPTPHPRRGELDSENSKLHLNGYQSANNAAYIIVA